MDDAVLIAVKYDCGYGARGVAGGADAFAYAHRGKRSTEGADISVRNTRMDADGDIQLGIGGGDDCGGSASGRNAGDIDAPRIGLARRYRMACKGRDNGRLTATALLVAGAMPVPAAAEVRRRRLLWVEHQKTKLVGKIVHASADREVCSRLCTAVEHDHERQPPPRRTLRSVQLLG